MDFHLKQWREQHQSDQQQGSEKMPRLLLLDPQPPPPPSASSALPLFSPEPNSQLSNLSADSTTTPTRFSRMGSCFSLGQWQELELQALIFRHMLVGAAVPPELFHLLKKSLVNSPPQYYLPHPLQHLPHSQPALLQSGYWGRGAMDPEPGRCRRTDGKKWRCSRDVVAGHKYCERHMHRGRNRSRKPVEIPTPTTSGGAGGNGGGILKTNGNPIAAQPLTAMTGGGTHFDLSGPSPSFDIIHLNQSSSESIYENKGLFRTQSELSEDGESGGRILRPFFDDWPRSVQEPDNSRSNPSSVTAATSLSISALGNPSSDFSLKLSTGNGEDGGPQERNVEREREQAQLNWGSSWGTNQVASMGGPLAEALRSSTSNSSPTSVLHQLQRGSRLEASYVSTLS